MAMLTSFLPAICYGNVLSELGFREGNEGSAADLT
jgi:hypothetical protein